MVPGRVVASPDLWRFILKRCLVTEKNEAGNGRKSSAKTGKNITEQENLGWYGSVVGQNRPDAGGSAVTG